MIEVPLEPRGGEHLHDLRPGGLGGLAVDSSGCCYSSGIGGCSNNNSTGTSKGSEVSTVSKSVSKSASERGKNEWVPCCAETSCNNGEDGSSPVTCTDDCLTDKYAKCRSRCDEISCVHDDDSISL